MKPTTKPASEAGGGPGQGEAGSPPSREFLLGRALAMQARREHSVHEIRQKLMSLGGDAEQVRSLLDGLVDRGLQSDGRFAEVFIRSRAERGYGPRAIEAELRQRAIPAELIDQAMMLSGYDWEVQARDVRQRRFGQQAPAGIKERARQARFLQYRGFTAHQAASALGRAPGFDD